MVFSVLGLMWLNGLGVMSDEFGVGDFVGNGVSSGNYGENGREDDGGELYFVGVGVCCVCERC